MKVHISSKFVRFKWKLLLFKNIRIFKKSTIDRNFKMYLDQYETTN